MYVSHSMDQSTSSEANGCSASQKIALLSCSPKAHYRVHKLPQQDTVLRQMNPVHTYISYFSKIHLNIVLPFTPRSPKQSLSFRYPDWNVICISHLSHACYFAQPTSSYFICSPRSHLSPLVGFAFPWICMWSQSTPLHFLSAYIYIHITTNCQCTVH
jgi:hypothetical protein